jgi:hypothetical protein
MKAQLTPQQKKAYEYQKEHFNPSEYPHAFRRKWPLKKSRGHRQYRHKVQQTLDRITLSQSNGVLEEAEVWGIRYRPAKKWPVLTMAEWLDSKNQRRVQGVGRKSFLGEHGVSDGQDRIVHLLDSLPRYPTRFAMDLAKVLESRMNRSERPEWMSPTWLWKFLLLQPKWAPRVRAWIQKMKED